MIESISSFFGPSGGLIFAVVAIVILLALAYIVIRLARQPNFGSGRRSKQARLAVTDAISFGNKKHKLVLVRRDDVEHLVLVGGPTDVVIESNIRRNAAVRPREQLTSEPVSAKALEPAAKAEEKPISPPRLRPVANESPPKPARPQFVPRQESADSPKPADVSDARPAVALATPHVRPIAVSGASTAPPTKPQPAPLPPVASPVAPAVTGGLVAAPLVAAAAADTDESEQESPFKDTHSGASKPSLEDDRSVESRANTTLTPTDRPSGDAADQPATKLETGRPGHSSVAEDMDALLDELSAKR